MATLSLTLGGGHFCDAVDKVVKIQVISFRAVFLHDAFEVSGAK